MGRGMSTKTEGKKVFYICDCDRCTTYDEDGNRELVGDEVHDYQY